MAMHYDVAVYIDGINRTPKTVMPIKCGEFLDERLNECHLSLRNVRKETFMPLTPVEIHIKEYQYYGEWNKNRKIIRTDEKKLYYIIANDDSVELTPASGIYNHDLYLIEVTKIAECVVVDTLTVTNDLGKNYSDSNSPAVPVWE